MAAVYVLKLAANSGTSWLFSGTRPPHRDSAVAFGGHFLLINHMHLFILCTRVALITAAQFSIFFFTISLQIEEAYKLHIILFQIF